MKKVLFIFGLIIFIASCKKSNDLEQQVTPQPTAKGYYLTSSTFNDYDSIVIQPNKLYSIYNGLLVYRLPITNKSYGYEFRNVYQGTVAKCKGVISNGTLTATWSKYNLSDTTINILPNLSTYKAYY